MQKRRGFSLIEILVAITLAAIIASYAAPMFSGLFQEEQFSADVEALFDTVSLARGHAMANKMCTKTDGTKVPSITWAVQISDTVPKAYRLFCVWDEANFKALTNLSVTNYAVAEDELVELPNGRVRNLHFFFNESATENPDGESMFVHFWSGSPQVSIVSTPYTDNADREDSVRVVIDSVFDTQQTICLDRIKGFPTLNQNGDTCL